MITVMRPPGHKLSGSWREGIAGPSPSRSLSKRSLRQSVPLAPGQLASEVGLYHNFFNFFLFQRFTGTLNLNIVLNRAAASSVSA